MSLRDELVPINKLHPIDSLLVRAGLMRRNTAIDSSRSNTSCCAASTTHWRTPTSCSELLNGKPAKVNLIPFNPFPGTRYRRSSVDTIMHFHNCLRQRGIVATTRGRSGDDIAAACGQLAGKVSDRVRKPLGEQEHGQGQRAR